MVHQDNTDMMRRVIEEIFNRGDLDVADALFAPTYVNHGGLIPDLVCGPEAIKFGVALYRAAFPAMRVTVDALAVDGEMVELHWSAHSPPPAARVGADHLGQGGTLTGSVRSRFADGQIAESWTRWDSAGVLGHLGIVPPRASPHPGPEASRTRPDGGDVSRDGACAETVAPVLPPQELEEPTDPCQSIKRG